MISTDNFPGSLLFTIGLPTFKRKNLLRLAVRSCIEQNYGNFELIVANDDPEDKISLSDLGCLDSRIRIINNPKNLGPVQNQNLLIQEAKGDFFIWLSDDDMFFPEFLEAVQEQIHANRNIKVLFTSYLSGDKYVEFPNNNNSKAIIYPGNIFLQKYLSRELRIISWYGIFRRDFLVGTGGMRQFGNGNYSPYADNLFAIEAGKLDSVIYIDRKLVFYRTHEGSISYTSGDAEIYQKAQSEMMHTVYDIFEDKKLKFYSSLYLTLLIIWCIEDYFAVVTRKGSISRKDIFGYADFIKASIKHISCFKYRFQICFSFFKSILKTCTVIIIKKRMFRFL